MSIQLLFSRGGLLFLVVVVVPTLVLVFLFVPFADDGATTVLASTTSADLVTTHLLYKVVQIYTCSTKKKKKKTTTNYLFQYIDFSFNKLKYYLSKEISAYPVYIGLLFPFYFFLYKHVIVQRRRFVTRSRSTALDKQPFDCFHNVVPLH
jgi:hypothetical protein